MTQEHLSRREREERAGEELAAKLDALSRPLAERVLGRAIELDAAARVEAEAAADTIDYETLKDVALEVGISETALKRALLEELDTDKDHNAGPLERLTVPDAIRGGMLVPGAEAEVAARLHRHLRAAEARAAAPAAVRRSIWAAAPRPPVHARTVPQAYGERQLVEIDAHTAQSRKRAWRWIVAVLILGALFGSPIGGLVILGIWVAGMVAVVGWLKRIGRSARRTVNRALRAAAGDQDAGSSRSWLDVWEDVQR